MIVRIISLSMFLFMLSACDSGEPNNSMPTTQDTVTSRQAVPESKPEESPIEQVTALLIEFQEEEQGVEPFITRMLITDDYIRIDEDGGSDGYVLYDRKNRRIFSILHESRKILVVDPAQPVPGIPEDLTLKEESEIDENAPLIKGIRPIHYKFFANDTLCYQVISLEGFLDDATSALQDFQVVLSAQQLETAKTTPQELQTPCYLANYIYAAPRYLSKGFPFQQWNADGYRRTLVNTKSGKSIDKALFAIPEGYEFFTLGGIGGGTIM